MSSETAHFDPMETIRLMARFKLGVKRQLNHSIKLDELQGDPTYACNQFQFLEDQIEDEELLVMMLTLRRILCPKGAALTKPASVPEAGSAAPAPDRYRLGVRC